MGPDSAVSLRARQAPAVHVATPRAEGDESTDLPGSSKFLPVKLSSPGPLSTQGEVAKTLEAEISEALALDVLSKCS